MPSLFAGVDSDTEVTQRSHTDTFCVMIVVIARQIPIDHRARKADLLCITLTRQRPRWLYMGERMIHFCHLPHPNGHLHGHLHSLLKRNIKRERTRVEEEHLKPQRPCSNPGTVSTTWDFSKTWGRFRCLNKVWVDFDVT